MSFPRSRVVAPNLPPLDIASSVIAPDAFAIARDAPRASTARLASPDALVYVHCQSGVNRAPSVAMAVLIAEERQSLLWAFSRVRAVRPSVRPKYIKEVAMYEEATLGSSSAPALRDGPDSSEFCDMYYGLKNDHSGGKERPSRFRSRCTKKASSSSSWR